MSTTTLPKHHRTTSSSIPKRRLRRLSCFPRLTDAIYLCRIFRGGKATWRRCCQDVGIKRGDVVSLLMPNSAEYLIGYFACWQLGALAGPVNSLLKEQENAYVISNSEAKAILIRSEFVPGVEPKRISFPYCLNNVFDDEADATRASDAQRQHHLSKQRS